MNKEDILIDSVVDAIGDTPLVELSRLVKGTGDDIEGRIVAKLDYLNPGFSKKDRIARQIIEDAESNGELLPGQTVVELTSGNTGTGLAIVCSVKGYPFIAVMSAGNSSERGRMMSALGAEVILVKQLPGSEPGQVSGGDLELVEKKAQLLTKELNANLIVSKVQDSIDQGSATEEKGLNASRNLLQTVTLLDCIEENQFDACLGGARRDEEKARAKERFFSHRDEFGQWDPKNQRPELWHLFNGKRSMGEHFRVFPISNWTEMDVWQYIMFEKLEMPSIYFSHKRMIIKRNGMLLADSEFLNKKDKDVAKEMVVRFRTIGDMTCTGAVESKASTVAQVVEEVAAARETERGTRADDKRTEAAMEDRKKEGYF